MKNSFSIGLHAEGLLYFFFNSPPLFILFIFYIFLYSLSLYCCLFLSPSLCVSYLSFFPFLILTSLPLLPYSTVPSHLLMKLERRSRMCLSLGPECICRPAYADRQDKQRLLRAQASQPVSKSRNFLPSYLPAFRIPVQSKFPSFFQDILQWKKKILLLEYSICCSGEGMLICHVLAI